MKNGINETVLIIAATFSCTISVSAEEITIKKPTSEQQYVEQIIIQTELQAYKETLTEYKNKSTFSNFISDIPGFDNSFQQKLDNTIDQYGIRRVAEDSLSIMPLVTPFTSGLNISKPSIYTAAQFSIINARGVLNRDTTNHNCSSTSSIGNTVKIGGNVDLPFYYKDSKAEIAIPSADIGENNIYCEQTRSSSKFTGVSISESGISFNIASAFNTWNKASIKH